MTVSGSDDTTARPCRHALPRVSPLIRREEGSNMVYEVSPRDVSTDQLFLGDLGDLDVVSSTSVSARSGLIASNESRAA